MPTIIAAASGYSVLTLHEDGSVTHDPIIAWIVFADARRRPVTAGEDRSPQSTIERSDGVVDEAARSFENRETWVASLIAERAAAATKATR